ncbi:MAG: TIGR04100 family radical SAM protein [Treponema sp.]|nr:TIGR04100 family radical SAM protein [Treponema sp.]
MAKSMTIVYPVHEGLYINLTNRCPCACTFCIRQSADGVHGSDPLWLDHEPSVAEVKTALQAEDMSKYKEVVFCGYGEPTERLDALLEIASFIKENYHLPVRINTNGLGNLIHQKDITPLFAGKIDALSISLNTSNPEIYERTVRPKFGKKAYPALLEFARNAVRTVPKVMMSTVATTISKEDEENCRKLCADLGVTYRIRAFVEH